MGNVDGALADDLATEVHVWARGWLAQGRRAAVTDPPRAPALFRHAAGAALVFLHLAPDDARAGRMRVVLIEGLDGAQMSSQAEGEAQALGSARAGREPPEVRRLHADMLLNLAWAHQQLARRLDASRRFARQVRARGRFTRAADYYRLYVEAFADSDAAPGALSELANCQLSAGAYLEAAASLERLAQAPARQAEALRRAIDAYQRALREAVEAEELSVRDEPPPASSRPPWADAPPIPEPLARVLEARRRYLAQTAPEEDPALRRHLAVENAHTLYLYARWDRARPALEALLAESCDDEPARRAAAALSVIAPDQERACAPLGALAAP